MRIHTHSLTHSHTHAYSHHDCRLPHSRDWLALKPPRALTAWISGPPSSTSPPHTATRYSSPTTSFEWVHGSWLRGPIAATPPPPSTGAQACSKAVCWVRGEGGYTPQITRLIDARTTSTPEAKGSGARMTVLVAVTARNGRLRTR